MKRIYLLPLLLVGKLAAMAQNSNTTLWRLVPPGGGKSSYLFGTIHLPRQSLLSFSDSVYAAINQTDYFFGELNYDKLMEDMSNPDNTDYFSGRLAYLDSVSKTPAWEQMVNRVNRRYNVQLKPDSMQQFIEFGINLSKDLYKPDTKDAGIMDVLLANHAKALGKKIGGLETFVRQVGMLYELIDARLQDSTIFYDDEVLMMRKTMDWYEKQQLDSVIHLMGTLHPKYNELIFYRRNRTMADSIALHTADKVAFFAIGCGHLPGDSGVISHLRRRGFVVLPVHGRERMSLLVVNDMHKLWKRKTAADRETEKPPTAPAEERMEAIKDDVISNTAPAKKLVKKSTKPKKKR